jgi:hypothetical protein
MAAINPPTDVPPARPEYEEPVDLDPVEPVEETGEDEPPAPETTLPPIVDPEGEIEALEDRSLPVERVLWSINRKGERVEEKFTQKGLSWFGKIELYGLLAQAVKVVMEGENPLGIGQTLDFVQNPRQMVSDLMGGLPGADTIPGEEEQDEADLELEAGKVIVAFSQVVTLAPELLAQAYCIALAIPKTHRNWAIEWAFPNMDDETGKDILHTFIDQNWGVMEDFFAHELQKIMKRIIKARQKASAGPR